MTNKILFISMMSGGAWGGSEELWFQTALKLKQQGDHVCAAIKYWKENARQRSLLRRAGIAVFDRDSFGVRTIRKYWHPNVISRKFDQWLPDLVVISQGDHVSGIDWMCACRKNKIPYVTIAHGANDYWWPQDAIIERLRDGYQNAQKCFFVSRANMKVTEKHLGVQLTQAEIIWNPFNVPYVTDFSWPDERILRLACVARLQPSAKGQDLLFDVLRLPKWRNRNITISLYGNGVNANALKTLAKIWHLDNVSFNGYSTDIKSIWLQHHALVLPSKFEGLPIAIIEAMLCGRLCIVTDVGGNAELIQDGQTGFIARSATVTAFDDALERAWESKHRWYEMGKAAAVAIRHLIPPEPVSIFAEQLKYYVKSVK